MKKNVSTFFGSFFIATLSAAISMVLAGCGVKGSPIPPLENPPIGIGKPSETPKKDDKKNTQKR